MFNHCLYFFCCFFFQAEDGRRDLVRSRGLGDVYKRQVKDECHEIYEKWREWPKDKIISEGKMREFHADILLSLIHI